MRERRRTALLKRSAAESLTLAIELFNRPVATARDSTVLILLGHSFEMLLKAAIFQSRGRIRDRGEKYSYGFGKTISIAHSDLGVIDDDEVAVLLAIKQDRDSAAHDTVSMSDDLLWLHARSALTIFGRVLRDHFDTDLSELIPARVIPVAAQPPSDPEAVIEREMQDIAALLAPRTRRGDEARARLRPLLALDGSITGREDPPTDDEIDRAVKALRCGREWRLIFPGLADLTLSEAPEPGSQEVTLRVVRTGEGVPVRQVSPDEAGGALLYRAMDPFQEFNIKLTEFGSKLGLSRQEGLAIVWELGLKQDPRSYFVKRTPAGNIIYQGLSARALHLAREAIATGLDPLKVVGRYNSRASS